MKISHTAILLTSALWLSACAVGPDFLRPDAPATAQYTSENIPKTIGAQSVLFGREIPAQWWMLFRSPQLTALIGKALKHSPDLQAALATLTQAAEMANSKESAFFPAVDANFSSNHQQITGAQFGRPDMAGSRFDIYNASVKVSYTLDVFGGVRRQLEDLLAETDYQRFQLEGAFLSLTSNIVTAAIEEAVLREQISVVQTLIKAREQQLGIVKKQLALGGTSNTDVLAQQATLDQQRTQLPPLQKQLQQNRHRLNVLIGEPPSTQLTEQFTLADLHLPTTMPVSLPSKLVMQRPDIRAQEALLHSASAKIGIATAAVFPEFTINANIGTIATHIGQMFSPASAIWSLGSNIAQPIFRAGEQLHRREATIANYDAVAARYRSTVLSALQNVADVLVALQADADAIQTQTTAEQTALASLELTRSQYTVGAVNYLSLLNAENTYQQARIGLIKARAAQLSNTAALFAALGGGWWQRADLARELAVYQKKTNPSILPFFDWMFK